MRSDVRFQLKVALEAHALSPTAVSDELKRRFLKKAELEIWKKLPVSIIAFVVVFYILIQIKLYFEEFFMPVMSIGYIVIFVCLVLPGLLVYQALAYAVAIWRRDYEFYEGEIIKEINDGYGIRGLKGHEIEPFIGEKNYNLGEKVIVARIEKDFYLISEY